MRVVVEQRERVKEGKGEEGWERVECRRRVERGVGQRGANIAESARGGEGGQHREEGGEDERGASTSLSSSPSSPVDSSATPRCPPTLAHLVVVPFESLGRSSSRSPQTRDHTPLTCRSWCSPALGGVYG